MINSGATSHPWFNRNVAGMGITSFLSDACHEMSTTVLPGFLAVIGAPPSALGFIEGASDAVSSFVKLLGGWISDKLGYRKLLVTSGYLLTALPHGLFALASSWHLVLFGRLISWFGRGFRSPIRDAMLADSVEAAFRGKAFGIHRMGDTLGAVLGPLLGVWFLSLWQGASLVDPTGPFRNVFLLSLIPGVLSAVIFAWLVKETRGVINHGLQFWKTVCALPREFKRFLLGVGIFGAGDFAPTLLILAATALLEKEWGLVRATQLAGLMYAVRNIVYALVSFPIGAFSDRVGRIALLAGGYFIAAATMAGFVLAFCFDWTSTAYLFLLFALAGVFISAEDTLEGAATADFIGAEARGTGMGVLASVNGIGDFLASVVVGWLWTAFSPVAGFAFAALLMLLGALFMLRVRSKHHSVG